MTWSAMRHLCDSNVILAAVVQRHPHHVAALKWIGGFGNGDTVVICRQTQISLLRLLTTAAIMKDEAQTNAAAISVTTSLMSDSRFRFIAEEPAGFEELWFKFSRQRTASPKTWMDSYLAAFAKGHSLQLVTFDKAFEKFRRAGVQLLVLA
jgi:uncharacterized protein